MNCIKVKYIYSACIVTETPDLKILHDPWFTEGIYNGSWFHFPVVNKPIKKIGDVDYIYISHIHPDHYDPSFLKWYFQVYGEKKIIIADHKHNFLAGKMRADGFNPSVLKRVLKLGNTSIKIIPHDTGSISDIDSAVIIKYKDKKRTHCVVNANDIVFESNILKKIKKYAGPTDIFLCGYTGAGPYPQTYFDIGSPEISKEAEIKKKSFFERYLKNTKYINAKCNIPFAGKYILGGHLANLNSYRGVADAVEVLDIDKKAIILSDNGGCIDTASLIATSKRTKLYSSDDIKKRIKQISTKKMDYEKLFNINEIQQLPIKRLLFTASSNAIKKSEVDEDYYFCIHLPGNEVAIINSNRDMNDKMKIVSKEAFLPIPRSELKLDPRLLFGLLTHIYHWNNAEVGSQYSVRRFPNIFNRNAQSFLNFLTI